MTVLVDPKTSQVVGQVLGQPRGDGTVKVLTREGTVFLNPMYYRSVTIDG